MGDSPMGTENCTGNANHSQWAVIKARGVDESVKKTRLATQNPPY